MEYNEMPECPVCLQSCNHPAKLPCGHVFCFLCVKGVAIKNKCCAMCRREIPPDYLDHPVLLPCESVLAQPQQASHTDAASAQPLQSDSQNELTQWYYEGRNGWWRYDERSNSELEATYNTGATDCQLLLAGAIYHINFRTMLQYRRTDITRRRRVKRDIPAAPAKGIAGIKMTSPSSDTERAKSVEDREDAGPELEDDDETTRPSRSSPSDSPPELETRSDAVIIPPPPQFDVVHSLRTLSLDAIEVPDSSNE